MLDIIKKRVIKDLAKEIESIDATSLELVGHNVISILEAKRMIHHGININYRPVGHTVDSFTDDSSIITEYSTDLKYFKNSAKKGTAPVFEKVQKDILHALDQVKPQTPKKIYLLSSQEEPPSFRAEFNSTSEGTKYRSIIVIYDSRELAKLIYEQTIDIPSAQDYYKQFFPSFSHNLDNYEYYGKIPSFCENHTSNPATINIIKDQLQRHDYGVLYGISGSGKTQTAIEYVHNVKADYENIIWIAGEDWGKDSSLLSIQRTRGGSPINVAGLFSSYKTLLVIDNLDRIISDNDLNELSSGFSKGSKVLLTSQLNNKGDHKYIQIPTISDDVALGILGVNSADTHNHRDIIRSCKFSPLILSTIRVLIEKEGVERDELYETALSNPQDITDSNAQSILDRILQKLHPNHLDALKKIANSGSPIHDASFLFNFIGLNRANLQKLSILLPAETPGFLKIHDLIFQAMRDGNDIVDTSLIEAFQKYIEKSNASMSPNIIRQIHLCYSILSRHLHDSNIGLDWITYALLQVEGDLRNTIQERLWSKPLTADLSLSALLCLIDAKEAHAYSIEDRNEKKEYFGILADEYKTAVDESPNDLFTVELLHHMGKSLRRCGKYRESLEAFLKLLQIDPALHASFLQIAHLGTQRRVDADIKAEGEKYMQKLIDCILEDYSVLPLRVTLAALARLRSYKMVNKKINKNPTHVKVLSEVLALSSFEGFSQFFEAFVAFTSMFRYHHSNICLKLIEGIPDILTISLSSVDEYNWINACEGYTNIAIAATQKGQTDLAKKIMSASILFADEIFRKDELKDYEARAIAKVYINHNDIPKALESMDKVPLDQQSHWMLYQKGNALLKLGTNEGGREVATRALELAKADDKATDRIAIYHDLISKFAEKEGDIVGAVSHLEDAIRVCKDDKYLNSLKEKVTDLRGS